MLIQSLLTIFVLIILEGLLSIDNALVLAVLARSVRPELQKKVLTYGLVGAVFLRMGAVFLATTLLQSPLLKVFGALYLLFLTTKHFLISTTDEERKQDQKARGFWQTIVLVELADLAFAVDSILAAVAMTDQYWIIITGGIIGMVMMRFAASQMIRLLNRFPKLEDTAFLLVGIIGLKLAIEVFRFPWVDFHSYRSPWFWGQWISMFLAILYGVTRAKKTDQES